MRLILAASFFLLISIISTECANAQDIRSMLPISCDADYKMQGGTKLYDVDSLYEHINGESEIFFPYGFKGMATASYVNPTDPNVHIVLDLYEMGSLLDAFGIYSNFRRSGAEKAMVGTEGFVEDSQLMFYKGGFFVRIYLSGALKISKEVLFKCASAIDSAIKAKPSPPKEIDVLGNSMIKPDSLKYLAQGVIGYPFFKRGFTAKADAKGKVFDVFVIFTESADSAKETLREYERYLAGEGIKLRSLKRGKLTFLTGTEPLYKSVLLTPYNRYIVGIVRLDDLKAGISIVSSIAKGLH